MQQRNKPYLLNFNLILHFKVPIFGILLIFMFSCTPAVRFSSQRGLHQQNEPIRNERSRLWQVAQSWLNVPYRFGGMDRNGIDCSALSRTLYLDVFGIELPRMAKDQMNGGTFVRQPWLKEGDLLFFRDDRGSFQDHVGVFLGDGQFIHASSSQGVIISDLFSTYYQERLIMARRYID
jgi:cell wall-associated NlpC family hydrolase